jgi:hypothetical protein
LAKASSDTASLNKRRGDGGPWGPRNRNPQYQKRYVGILLRGCASPNIVPVTAAPAICVNFPTFPHLSMCMDNKGEEMMHVSATPHRQPALRSNQSRDQFPHWPQDLRPWIDGSTTSGSVRVAKQAATIIQLYVITGIRLCVVISVWTFFQCEFRRFTKSACMRSPTTRVRKDYRLYSTE